MQCDNAKNVLGIESFRQNDIFSSPIMKTFQKTSLYPFSNTYYAGPRLHVVLYEYSPVLTLGGPKICRVHYAAGERGNM